MRLERMESIHNRTRAAKIAGGTNSKVGKNYLIKYIREVWDAMTKQAKRGIEKAEENPTRTQLWANVVLSLSMAAAIPFFGWLGLHLVDYGEQRANQRYQQQEIDKYKEQVKEREKEIEALKQQANEQQETVAPKPKPSRKSQNARGSKPKINGQVKKLDYAKYANFRLSL